MDNAAAISSIPNPASANPNTSCQCAGLKSPPAVSLLGASQFASSYASPPKPMGREVKALAAVVSCINRVTRRSLLLPREQPHSMRSEIDREDDDRHRSDHDEPTACRSCRKWPPRAETEPDERRRRWLDLSCS
jgi:hypothetical protein